MECSYRKSKTNIQAKSIHRRKGAFANRFELTNYK